MGLRSTIEGFKSAKAELAAEDAVTLARVRSERDQKTDEFAAVKAGELVVHATEQGTISPAAAQAAGVEADRKYQTGEHKIVVTGQQEIAQIPVAVTPHDSQPMQHA